MSAQLFPGRPPEYPSASGAASPPMLRIRGRSVMALVLAPEPPFTPWFAALDQQMRLSPAFFADRPVIVDLSAVFREVGPDGVPVTLDGMESRGLRIIGTEGIGASMLADTRWAQLSTSLPGRDVVQTPGGAPPQATPTTLLVDRPVRSGQSIVFEEGDIIVVGAVASGSEVVAGGSIHVYGALRGRALAGLKTNSAARIFCRRLEAEMVGVNQLYRTAEHWGPDLQGRAAQIRCDRGALRILALD